MNASRDLAKSFAFVAPVVALSAWPGIVHANAPPGRYTVSNGGTPTGTVYDTFTKLTWQQQVSSTTYTWSGAGTYCTGNTPGLPGTGWRLPTLKELQTIVDYTITSPPMIDPIAFPSAPASWFWTSSPVAGYPHFAWLVSFYFGGTYYLGVGSTYSMRCVR